MEPAARQAFTSEIREQIFKALDVPFGDCIDLKGFENFVYRHEDRVIRITHNSHRSESQLLGELEFVRWLDAGGAAVAQPLSTPVGTLLMTVDDFHVCLFAVAAGHAPDRDKPFNNELIRAWGRAIGRFHRRAQDFEPVYRRQDWLTDENHDFRKRIPAKEAGVIEAGEALLQLLKTQPYSRETYGLIHSDAHAGNFYRDGDELTFFDFDDCLYSWFGYDLGTILFGAVHQSCVADTDHARQQVAENFLSQFLSGYREENVTRSLLLDEMPHFIALREFSQYAVIHAHMDVDNLEPGLSQRFFHAIRRRFAEGRPLLDIDFGRFT